MIRLSLLLLSLSTSIAVAQPGQLSPSQAAIQINTVIGQWAQTIEAQQKSIMDLQQEVTKLKAENEALKKEKANAK